MKQLKKMKDCLMEAAYSQINNNLATVDTKELGEVIDMIKDLEEAIYYCTITEAMEEHEEKQTYRGDQDKWHETMYYPPYDDMSKKRNKMHRKDTHGRPLDREEWDYEWDENESTYPIEIRDHREGKSPMARRSYMESKELHKDKNAQIQELDRYMKELADDVTEMIKDASPEERAMLQQKLTTLAAKVK